MFKTIPGTNGLYQCNKKGEIKRIEEIVNFGNRKRKCGGTILKAKTKSNGYQEVNLIIEKNKGISKYVHRLIVTTWIGEIPENMNVNHKDGNKSNNNLSNLEVVSRSENMKHAYKLGLSKPRNFKGSVHPRAKTNEKEVIKMRKEHAQHHSIIQLHKDYPHLTKGSLANIVYRACWKHI